MGSKWGIACAAAVKCSDILDVIICRLNGDERGFVDHHFLAPPRKVLSYFFHQTQSVMLFLILLPTLLLPARWPDLKWFALLSSPLLIPVLWFETLSDHTQIHFWIIYRQLSSCFGILIAAAILASRGDRMALADERAPGERESADILQQQGIG